MVRRSSSTERISEPSCSSCDRLLRLLVDVELALDSAGGAVEEIDGRPEEVVEVGFEARLRKRGDERVEDVGDRALGGGGLGQRPRVRLVGKGPVAEELELGEKVRGRGRGLRGFTAGFGSVGRHVGCLAWWSRALRGLHGEERRRAGRACTVER